MGWGWGGAEDELEISTLPLSSFSGPPQGKKKSKMGSVYLFFAYARECQHSVVRLKPRERRICIYAYCSLSPGLVRGFFFSLPCLKMFKRFTKYNIKMRNMTCFFKKKRKKNLLALIARNGVYKKKKKKRKTAFRWKMLF